MSYKPTCLVCQKEMEVGFLTDLGHANSVHLPRWCAGAPEPGFWNSIVGSEAASSQAKAGLKVTAYRCPTCKALRLYAFDEPAKP